MSIYTTKYISYITVYKILTIAPFLEYNYSLKYSLLALAKIKVEYRTETVGLQSLNNF